jgi:hypothetical protein
VVKLKPWEVSDELWEVVEQTFALLHAFRRLRIRWEVRADIHEAFLKLACALICWRHPASLR